MALPTVIFKKEVHRNQLVLSIYMPKSESLNDIVKKLGATYSSTKKMWWLPWGKAVVNKAYKAFKGIAWVDYSALKVGEKGRSDNSIMSEYANGSTASTAVTPRHEGSHHKIGRDASSPSIKNSGQAVSMTRETLRASAKQSQNLKGFAWTEAQKKAMWAFADKLTIRRYSKSAFTTYGFYFKQFLAAHPGQDPKEITEEQIIAHVIKTVQEKNYATKTQNQIQPVGFYT